MLKNMHNLKPTLLQLKNTNYTIRQTVQRLKYESTITLNYELMFTSLI